MKEGLPEKRPHNPETLGERRASGEETRRSFDREKHPSVFVQHRGIAVVPHRSQKSRPHGRDFKAILKKNQGERVILPGKHVRASRARIHVAFFISHLKMRDKKAQNRLCGGRRAARCDLKEHTPYIQRAVVMDEGHTRMMAVVRARGVPWYPT